VSRTRRCTCEGHWAHKLVHYVVTRRHEAFAGKDDRTQIPSEYSEVKCMQCYRKWRSRANYVARLKDHQERSYLKLTDQEILVLLIADRIRVLADGTVKKEKRHFSQWTGDFIELRSRFDRNRTPERGRPYLFVTIYFKGARKEIALHRLVWMAHNLRTVPPGYDVDHCDRDKTNNGINNLRLLESAENQADDGHVEREWETTPF